MIKFFNKLRDKLRRPKRMFTAELVIVSKANGPIGKLTITTTARSRKGAEENITEDVRLQVCNIKIVKENLNGHKK
jgi:hypothetical protein